MSESGPLPDWDPVFLHGRREAAVIFAAWVIALLWTVPYCYLAGYSPAIEGESVSTVLGIPGWVFWGIAAPWLAANGFTVWFCCRYMKDDDLGESQE